MKKLNNVRNFNQFKLNESLNYCNSCHSLSDTPICNFCQILDIIGVTKDTDEDMIYGKLKYYKNFKPQMVKDYIDSLTMKYNLTDEQKEKIMELL
jgi:hypothetical protein